jgi:hypothetical protein
MSANTKSLPLGNISATSLRSGEHLQISGVGGTFDIHGPDALAGSKIENLLRIVDRSSEERILSIRVQYESQQMTRNRSATKSHGKAEVRIPSFVRLEHLVVRGNASRVRQTLEFRGRSSLQVILVAQVLIPRKRDQPLNPTVVPGYLPSAILHQAPIDRGTDRGGFPKSR